MMLFVQIHNRIRSMAYLSVPHLVHTVKISFQNFGNFITLKINGQHFGKAINRKKWPYRAS